MQWSESQHKLKEGKCVISLKIILMLGNNLLMTMTLPEELEKFSS